MVEEDYFFSRKPISKLDFTVKRLIGATNLKLLQINGIPDNTLTPNSAPKPTDDKTKTATEKPVSNEEPTVYEKQTISVPAKKHEIANVLLTTACLRRNKTFITYNTGA